jgi:hypothetical protein
VNTKNQAENGQDLGVLLQASLLDFPLALQKWTLGNDGHEVEEAVLKACQAWTNLANKAMERVFEAEGFVGLTAASVRHFGQWQRVARDFIESIMHSAGARSPSGNDEIKELREGMNRMRREVRSLTARVNLLSAGNQLELHTAKSTDRGLARE